MEILAFILEHFTDILLVIATIVAVCYFLKTGQTKLLKQMMFGLVTKAEADYGAGTGDLKFSAVAEEIYKYIPAALKPLFTSKDIAKLIEDALEAAKKAWAESAELEAYTTPSEPEQVEEAPPVESISALDLKNIIKEAVSETIQPPKKTTKKAKEKDE